MINLNHKKILKRDSPSNRKSALNCKMKNALKLKHFQLGKL